MTDEGDSLKVKHVVLDRKMMKKSNRCNCDEVNKIIWRGCPLERIRRIVQTIFRIQNWFFTKEFFEDESIVTTYEEIHQ